MRDWLYIAMRIPQVVWAFAIGMIRTGAPSFAMCFAMLIAYAMGEAGVSSWWTLSCMVVGSFALTLTENRAEAKEATKWAHKIFDMIASDHSVDITVTTKTEPSKAWEPVYIMAARKPVVSKRLVMRDWIMCPITMRKGLTGAKPEAVCHWAFEIAAARPDDELDDLFPGTGAVTEAWRTWRGKFTLPISEAAE